MTAILFFPFFVLNILIIIWIVRWRGLCSFEGLGMALLLLVVLSDGIGLMISYFTEPSATFDLISSRIYPTIIHIIGLIAFSVGLFIVTPKPISISQTLNLTQKNTLIKAAWFIIALGLFMKCLSLYGSGINWQNFINSYFFNLGSYVISQRKFGGFLDSGLDIALFGLGLIAVHQKTIKKQILTLGIMATITYIFSFSRAGIVGVLITFFVLLFIFNRKKFKFWLHPVAIALLIFIVILTAGIKSQLRVTNVIESESTLAGKLNWGVHRFLDRFSTYGLYDGYANFINRLTLDESRLKKGEVIKYTATSWVPYLIYKNKPPHPFRAIGDLVYRNKNVSIEDVSAVTLVGTAFFDYGLYSVLLYLLLYGILLGLLRKITIKQEVNILLLIWYLHFMLIDGGTNIIHGGIVNIFGTIVLASGVTVLVFIYLKISLIAQSVIAKPINLLKSSKQNELPRNKLTRYPKNEHHYNHPLPQ